jgi:hypothetical protein
MSKSFDEKRISESRDASTTQSGQGDAGGRVRDRLALKDVRGRPMVASRRNTLPSAKVKRGFDIEDVLFQVQLKLVDLGLLHPLGNGKAFIT